MFLQLHRIALLRLPALRSAPPEIRPWLGRAARAGRVPRLLWFVIALFGGLLAIAAQSWFLAYRVHVILWDETASSFDSIIEDISDGNALSYLLALAVAAAFTLVELLIARVIWLRIRARHVLRHRDRCAFCNHGLTGTPLVADGTVVCPECAKATPAVAEWNEVSVTGDRPTFQPTTGLCPAIMSRRRVVLTAKLAAALCTVAALGYGGWWSFREIVIRREAAKARADRLGSDALNAMLRADQPPQPPEGKLISDLIARISGDMSSLSGDFTKTHSAELNRKDVDFPDPSYISFRPFDSDPKAEATRALSIQLIEHYRSGGIYALMDELPAASPWNSRRITTIDEPEASPASLGESRKVLRLCIARMKLARDAGDLPEFERASAAAVAIAGALDNRPLLIDWLVATAADDSILSALSAILIDRPDRRWADAIEHRVASIHAASLSKALKNEDLLNLDSVAWYFSEPSRVRKGMDAPELKERLGIGLLSNSLFESAAEEKPRRLGTYTENVQAIKKFASALDAHARVEAWQRGTLPPIPVSGDLVIPYESAGILAYTVRNSNSSTLRHRTVRVMLDLERFRLDHGDYPPSLEDLPPSAMGTRPMDPFSNKPFGYRRTDAASDPFHCGYLLWTVGLDGIDNGGNPGDRARDAALRPEGKGADMILNDPRW